MERLAHVSLLLLFGSKCWRIAAVLCLLNIVLRSKVQVFVDGMTAGQVTVDARTIGANMRTEPCDFVRPKNEKRSSE